MSAEQIIDLRLGETRTIRDITCSLYDLEHITLDMETHDWEYQPAGYVPLIRMLEAKHNAPIIVTNGANQALHAACHVLKLKGYKNVGIRTPYWNRIPDIINSVGINYTPFVGSIMSKDNLKIDSYLLTMPNNPDGFIPSWDTIRAAASLMRENGIPLIHDAAYYTRSYLPVDHPIESIGDLQIFSASKTYGLSSLRVGYIVVYNASYYQQLLDFMERTTVGVSVLSQKQFLHILKREEQLSFLQDIFVKQTRESIRKTKLIFKEIDQKKVEISSGFDHSCGVFAWVKPLVKDIFTRTNIAVLPGEIFGDPEYARINLTAGYDLIGEAVKRINKL